ncbi:MAG: 4Fe-4S binding protein [Candidatus Aenigmatarchaeota archaeon]
MTVIVDKKKCLSCGGCVGVCPKLALELKNGLEVVCDPEKCINCALCVKFCPVGALKLLK